MADELEKQDNGADEPKKKQGLSLVMIIGLIVGFLVVQVAAIYIIFTMFVAPANNAEAGKEKDKKEQHGEHSDSSEDGEHGDAHASGGSHQEDDMPEGGYRIRKVGEIIPIKCGGKDEIILNPRGSSSRYVIVSVGLEMRPSSHGEGEEEESGGHGDGHGGGGDAEDPLMVPVCDKIISIISSKTLEELQLPNMRDSLRTLLRQELQPYYGEKRIRTVYFPRFIIQ